MKAGVLKRLLWTLIAAGVGIALWFGVQMVNGRDVALRVERSREYALEARFDAAIAEMDAALALDPTNPALYVERGQRILLLYEWDRVLDDYNRALELDPNYADAYFYRGILFYTQGPREQAVGDFERYLQLAPAGEHAVDAASYADAIRAELAALDENG